jgi:hypothetical protein
MTQRRIFLYAASFANLGCRPVDFTSLLRNPEFARFLDSSRDAYIKQVTMQGQFSQMDEMYIPAQSIWQLERVVKLHIQTFNWESVEALNSASFSFLRPETIFAHHLTSLTLRSISFPSFTVVTDFLNAFDHRRILVF